MTDKDELPEFPEITPEKLQQLRKDNYSKTVKASNYVTGDVVTPNEESN